jgi:FkbM family methyltransferase
MMKDLIRSWVQPLGIDIVKFPQLSTLERQLRTFLRANEINLVIDVGACDGFYSWCLRGPMEYRGRIVSLEPSKQSFNILKSQMATDGLWRGINVGASDKEGGGLLNTYERREFNSILELREQDAANYEINLATKAIEKIELRTIDSLWGEITEGIPDPRVFLKIDTQGHDKAVIRGAEARLGSVIGLQTEVPVIHIYDGMTPMVDTLNYLSGLGYIPIGFHAVNQPDSYNGAAPEFDVVFQRER